MNTLYQHLFGFDRDETPGEVIFFKAFELFILGATLHLAWMWGQGILQISEAVSPLGLAQYMDVSFMYGNSAPLINATVITILVVVGFLRMWRGAYFTAFLLLHLQFVARYSLGAIPHSSNLTGMALLAVGLATLAFGSPKARRRFTMGFTYFFVGLSYTLAAVCKLVARGPLWADGNHLRLWIYEKAIDSFSKYGAFDLNMLQEMAVNDHTLATAFLTVGLLTEAFAWLFFFRRFRLPVGIAIIGLHVGIYLVMNILFYLSVIEVVLLAFPWAMAINWALKKRALQPVLRPLHKAAARFS